MIFPYQQKTVGILGMGRSGTSAVARAINLLGAYIGRQEQLMPPKGDNNPEGFWEHLAIVDFHERLLRRLSHSWDNYLPMPEEWWREPEIRPFRKELISLIQREFGDRELWMWKDPRTSLMLPLWIEVLNELDMDVCYVICLRNPLDVASSLRQRDGFARNKTFALWQLYNLSSIYWTRESRRLILHYDKLLEDWEQCLKNLANAFDIPWPRNDHDLRTRISTFLRPGLRHSHSGPDSLIQDKDLPEPLVSAHSLLIEAEESPEFLNSTAFSEKASRLYLDYCTYAEWVGSVAEAERFQRQTIQVFWPSENTFSEENSTRTHLIVDGEFHSYDLVLPLTVEGHLRLDPVNFPAHVEIKSIELCIVDADSSEPCGLARWSEEEGFEGLIPGIDVIRMNGHKAFRFISTTDDPQIFLENIRPIEDPQEDKELILRILMKVHNQIFCNRTKSEYAEWKGP